MKTKFLSRLTLAALFLISPVLLGFHDIRAADMAPLHIVKRVDDAEESILVQDGKLARLNPDGTHLLVSCLVNEQTVTFINDEQGVYWEGPFEQFVEELQLFMIVHLLHEDPEVRYAVQVRVEEAGEESIAGYPTQHFRVQWRPDALEGGDEAAWKPLQDLWVAPGLTELLAPTGCQQPAVTLEILQLLQGAFSSQRFYGLMNSEDYGPAVLSGFPVRVKLYTPGSDHVLIEVTSVSDGPSPSQLFDVSDSLLKVDGVSQVF